MTSFGKFPLRRRLVIKMHAEGIGPPTVVELLLGTTAASLAPPLAAVRRIRCPPIHIRCQYLVIWRLFGELSRLTHLVLVFVYVAWG